MHPEQTVDNRHRPLPLEPFASRESYVAAPSTGGGGGGGVGTGGHYQQSQQQQQQQEYQSVGPGGIQQQQSPSASALAAAEHKRNQEFNEHLRKSLTGEGQRGGNGGSGNNINSTIGANSGEKLLLPVTNASPGGFLSTDGKGGLLTTNNGVSISSGNVNGVSSISTTGGRPYPPILPWTEDIEQPARPMISIPKIQSSPPPQSLGGANSGSGAAGGKGQKVRRKWTDQETKDLLTGCSIVSDSFVCVCVRTEG